MTLNAATRAHLWRLIRITAFGLATAPAVVALFNTWALKYPLLAGLPAILEVIWRTIAPTVPAPPLVAKHAGPSNITEQQLTQAPKPPPLSSQVYFPVTTAAPDVTIASEHGPELVQFTKPGKVIPTPSAPAAATQQSPDKRPDPALPE